jgi:hypothetical protein
MKQTKWLGFTVSTMDLGGQSSYRNNYISKEGLFEKVFTLFFVIDIQDFPRFDEAIDYYSQIIKKIKEINESPRIAILYNKIDSEIRESPKIKADIEILTNKIRSISESLPITFHQTSIYDIISINTAFFENVIKYAPKAAILDNYLREYAKLTFSSAVVLFDESLLIVSENTTDARYIEICRSISPWILNAADRIQKYGINLGNIAGDMSFNKDKYNQQGEEEELTGRFFIQRFYTEQKMEFILISLSRNKNCSKLNEKGMPLLIKQISDLINTVYGNCD